MSNDNYTTDVPEQPQAAHGSEDPTQVFQAPSPTDSQSQAEAPDNQGGAEPADGQRGASGATSAPFHHFDAAQPLPAGPKVLSNAVAFTALGAMAFIAAVGLLFFFNGMENNVAGRAVLISVGLIVIIAGAVISYAGLKGQRPGWFLPFTIVGALFAVPIATVGGAMTAYPIIPDAAYFEESSSWGSEYRDHSRRMDEDWDEDWVDEDWAVSGWTDETLEDLDQADFFGPNSSLTRVDSTQTSIISEDERLLLDLTEVEDVHNLAYRVSLTDSELNVLLTDDQLALVPQWTASSSSLISSGVLMPFGNEDDTAWALESWVDAGFDRAFYPFDLGLPGEDPDATISFSFALNGNSVLRFVMVDEDAVAYWSEAQDKSASPQSGTTTHHEEKTHKPNEKNDGE